NYIELNDPAYQNNWLTIPMFDDGTSGDVVTGDSIYTVILPAALQIHRRLIRYRITAADAANRSLTVPYEDDPEPNFAYFAYHGVPAWQAAIQPGSTDATRAEVQTFSAAESGRLPT